MAREQGRKVIADNRKARHDYAILETKEAGLELLGTEVKSLRTNGCTLREAYIRVRDGEAYVVGMHIPPYDQGNIHNHDPLRDRRMLLHAREIEELQAGTDKKGLTIVPLVLYFVRGKAKLEIGIARGKSGVDKRRTMAERDAKRQMEQAIKQAQRGD